MADGQVTGLLGVISVFSLSVQWYLYKRITKLHLEEQFVLRTNLSSCASVCTNPRFLHYFKSQKHHEGDCDSRLVPAVSVCYFSQSTWPSLKVLFDELAAREAVETAKYMLKHFIRGLNLGYRAQTVWVCLWGVPPFSSTRNSISSALTQLLIVSAVSCLSFPSSVFLMPVVLTVSLPRSDWRVWWRLSLLSLTFNPPRHTHTRLLMASTSADSVDRESQFFYPRNTNYTSYWAHSINEPTSTTLSILF